MDKKYEPLFTPWKIGNVEIKNRIVMTSMGGTSIFGWMKPNHFDKEAAHFLLERAKNNVGLILPGIAPLRNPILGQWLYSNKGMYRKLKSFMGEIHKTGAKMFVQITAGFGRSMAVNKTMEAISDNAFLNFVCKPILNVDACCMSASPNPNRWSDKVPSKEMSEKQIRKFIDGFAKVAKLCQEADVDGVEVHAVHEGYLLDQFTLKYANQRTDKWGGSFENRYRFPVEIVRAIKKACGENYPVSLRYSVVSKTKGFREGALPGEEYIEVGRDLEEGKKAAKYLEDAGYDMLNCDNGTYDAWYWSHPPLYMPENCNLPEAEAIKPCVKIPVVCAGRMSPDVAAEAIKDGKIDAMGVARQFLADPEWVTKLMEGRVDDIRPCICCHNACFTMAHYKGVPNDQDMEDTVHMARCAINAETMQSDLFHIEKTKKPKSVAIVGGGIGGMEAARVLVLRGHKPVIYEKTGNLGGVFHVASTPSFKKEDKLLLEWYKKQMKDLGVEIRFNSEVRTPDVLKEDEVIVATGSKPRRFAGLPGIEKTIEACEYLGGKEVGDNVVVVGGGLTGCEIAYDLYLKGKKPSIVEMKDDLIAQKGVCMANSTYLREFFAWKKVPVYLNSKAKEVKDGSIVVTGQDGKDFEVKADSVIVSIGYVPTPLAPESKRVHLVGDCLSVGNLRSVIWRAYAVAMKI
ncbi:MAG: FAD-dependent oxidoreductase [Bacilli bacterium]|jgi:2-enoate reductase|nr:FAD-dependent oxidoreductase [Bacilli bacterium]